MTLQEFLSTASQNNQEALDAAKTVTTVTGRLISSGILTIETVKLGLYSVFNDVAATVGHPARDMCMAISHRLRTDTEFDFIQGTPAGDDTIAMVDMMAMLIPEKAAEFASLKTFGIAQCNSVEFPFAYATLHTVMSIRGQCPTIENCMMINGYFVIENSVECPMHSPTLWGQNPRTLAWVSLGRFPMVSAVGRYELMNPGSTYSAFRIDNAYGGITCLKTL